MRQDYNATMKRRGRVKRKAKVYDGNSGGWSAKGKSPKARATRTEIEAGSGSSAEPEVSGGEDAARRGRGREDESGNRIYTLSDLMSKTRGNFLSTLRGAIFDAWKREAFWSYTKENDSTNQGRCGPSDGYKGKDWDEPAISQYWFKGRGWTKSHSCRMGMLAAARVLRSKVDLPGRGSDRTFCSVHVVGLTLAQMGVIWTGLRSVGRNVDGGLVVMKYASVCRARMRVACHGLRTSTWTSRFTCDLSLSIVCSCAVLA